MELYNHLVLLFIVFLTPSLRKHFFSVTKNQEIKSERKRIPKFDFIRGLARIVITANVIYIFLDKGEVNFYLGNFLNNITRFAIPCFFITSGILLTTTFESKSDWLKFYKTKALRVLLPFVVASTVIAIFQKDTFVTFITDLVNGDAAESYYFIIVLLQLYIVYPVLLKYKNSRYFLIATYVISLLFYASNGFVKWGSFPFMGQFLYLFAYGVSRREMYITDKIDFPRQKMLMLVSVYLVFSVILSGYYYNVRYFYGIAIFSLLYYYKSTFTGNWIERFIIWYGKHSLWIFLTQIFTIPPLYFLIESTSIPVIAEYALLTFLSIPVSAVFGIVAESIYENTIGRIVRNGPHKKYAVTP